MKASEEIRSILDRCKSGELDHLQEEYFCETSRCIAGWKAHFDFCKLNNVKTATTQELVEFTNYVPGYYAANAWGLSPMQKSRLFYGGATFPQQYAVVAELEAQGK